MRTTALALMLLLAACGRAADGGNAGAAGNATAPGFAGDDRNAAATLTLAASGSGGCSARWDGQPATPAQVLERASALIEHAIQQQGSVANLTEETIPAVAVTAPATLGFGCADTYLGAVQRSGVTTILLAPEGGTPALVDFTLSDIGGPPPSVVLGIGAGGRVSWNNEAIALDAIAERVRRLAGGETAPADMVAARGELELRPTREASFGQVHQALSAVRAMRVRAALLLPSVERAPPGAAPTVARAPPPPPPPPPPLPPSSGNETAPLP